MTKSASRAWLPLAGAIVGIAVFWGGVVPHALEPPSAQPSLSTFDYYNYFLPRFEFGNAELESGRLPIWNRFEYGGIPFLATAQPAPLYPPKILAFAAFEAGTAMQVFLVAHYALLAGGFLWFARRQGLHGLGALAGTLFWTFSTTVLLSNYHPNRIACLVWVPGIFLLADRIARVPGTAAIAGLGILVALQLTAGYPAFTLSLAVLLGVHAVAMFALGEWSRPPWQTLPAIALGFVLGTGLAALQIAPLAELGLISERAEHVASNAPEFLRSIRYFVNWRGPAGPGLIFLLFPGLAGFALAAVVRRRAAPAVIGLAACLMMAFGGWTLLRPLPGFALIRHGLIWLFCLQFYLAWLVALGADRFAQTHGGSDTRGRWLIAFAGVVWAALCIANGLYGPPASDNPSPSVGQSLYGGTAAHIAGGLGGLLLVAAAAVDAGRQRIGLTIVAVTAILFGQQLAFPFGSTPGRFDYPRSELRVAEQVARFDLALTGRVVSEADRRDGYALHDRVPLLFGAELTFMPPRFRALEARILTQRLQRVRWQALLPAQGFLDAMNVAWVVGPAHRAAEFANAGLVPAGRLLAARIPFQNLDRMGEAWVAYRPKLADGADAALDRLLAPDFDPRREVIVEGPLASRYGPSEGGALPAEVVHHSPTELEVLVETPHPGIVVVSEAFFPGWRAFVDDVPAELVRANYVLRGVEVPAGRHRVRMDYEPDSIRLGKIATALSAIATVLLVALDRRWRDRPRASRQRGSDA